MNLWTRIKQTVCQHPQWILLRDDEEALLLKCAKCGRYSSGFKVVEEVKKPSRLEAALAETEAHLASTTFRVSRS